MPLKNKIFTPTTLDYLKHLTKYADRVKPPELIEWCAEISPVRTKRVVKMILEYKNRQAKVLELGCGIGLNSVSLAKTFPKTIAVDVDKMVLRPAQEFLRKFGLKNQVTIYDGQRLPFSNNSFDVVVCVEVFEHAADHDKLLEEAKRVLKPNGIMHITAPNKWWPIEGHYQLPFLSYLPKKAADAYVRLFKKGPSYENIYLFPTYSQFYQAVNKYFTIEDVTFKSVIDYKKYDIDKERGWIVKWLALLFRLIKKGSWLNKMLLNISIGWLFMARPRK